MRTENGFSESNWQKEEFSAALRPRDLAWWASGLSLDAGGREPDSGSKCVAQGQDLLRLWP